MSTDYGFRCKQCGRVTKGLPKDAVFIASTFDESRLEIGLVFSHDTFPVVLPGAEIPVFMPEYHKYTSIEEMKKAGE